MNAGKFSEALPGWGAVEIAIGNKHAGGGHHMDVRVPEEKVAERLHGDNEARLAVGLAGALAEPDGEGGVRGVVEFGQQGAVEFERISNQPGNGEYDVAGGAPGHRSRRR